MTIDISGFGSALNIVADSTFPAGFDVTQFADDADPFDLPDLKIADAKMGLNGDFLTWSVAALVTVKVAVVPDSDDDQNLQILYDANRVGPGKASAADQCTLVISYPDGSRRGLSGGRIVEGPPGTSLAAAGRKKTKTYTFMFGGTSSQA